MIRLHHSEVLADDLSGANRALNGHSIVILFISDVADLRVGEGAVRQGVFGFILRLVEDVMWRPFYVALRLLRAELVDRNAVDDDILIQNAARLVCHRGGFGCLHGLELPYHGLLLADVASGAVNLHKAVRIIAV